MEKSRKRNENKINNKIPDNYNINLSSIENYHKVDSRIIEYLK